MRKKRMLHWRIRDATFDSFFFLCCPFSCLECLFCCCCYFFLFWLFMKNRPAQVRFRCWSKASSYLTSLLLLFYSSLSLSLSLSHKKCFHYECWRDSLQSLKVLSCLKLRIFDRLYGRLAQLRKREKEKELENWFFLLR